MNTTVAVVGATGKLGLVVVDVVSGMSDFDIIAELNSSSSLTEIDGADVIIDVTNPATSPQIVDYALARGKPILVGSSGWSDDRIHTLRSTVALTGGSVIIVPNFSLGSVLSTVFAQLAAPFFDSIEIVESHRSSKVDSPSGTAVRTAELIAKARRVEGPVDAPYVDQRARGQQVASIPVHSLRMSGVIAQQQVVFGGKGERITVVHDTISGESYRSGIEGALRAVPQVQGVVVGLDQVLNLHWDRRTSEIIGDQREA